MAHQEDTELRDLVIDALNKNGSLAKIRALLRANVFKAFEDGFEQNDKLDKVMNVPEGLIALSIVHEFLDFCDLRNSLFVYTSESHQGNGYKYEGRKNIAEKLHFPCKENEPLIVLLVKQYLYLFAKRQKQDNEKEKLSYKDDQNNTYIVHEDSNSTSSSQTNSDSSYDEKNKLHLRLQLDNSDTDTSSDSTRDKIMSSEYIPSEHIVPHKSNLVPDNKQSTDQAKDSKHYASTSNESTSYLELCALNRLDKKLMNMTGVPIIDSGCDILPHIQKMDLNSQTVEHSTMPQNDASQSSSVNNGTSLPSNNENIYNKQQNLNTLENVQSFKNSSKSDEIEYTCEFSSISTQNKNSKTDLASQVVIDNVKSADNSLIIESPHHNSHSSISISDVADLIDYSDKSVFLGQDTNSDGSNTSYNKLKNSNDHVEENSHENSESPIPSLSNLSMDVQST